MANCIDIDKNRKELITTFQKVVQSANLNFLIGSGCSLPAIKTLGNIEKDVQKKIKNGKEEEAEKLIFNFLKPFVESTKTFIDNALNTDHSTTLNNYIEFIGAISKILFERKSNILHKQATIFSTNYDLFIEKTSEQFADSLLLNDGFKRTPSLSNTFNNVEIVYSKKENIDFKIFIAFLAEILPESNEKPIYKVEIKNSNNE